LSYTNSVNRSLGKFQMEMTAGGEVILGKKRDSVDTWVLTSSYKWHSLNGIDSNCDF